MDDSAARFVGKMREAAFADIDAKLKHQSALSKVRMLESVKKQLNKYGSTIVHAPDMSSNLRG